MPRSQSRTPAAGRSARGTSRPAPRKGRTAKQTEAAAREERTANQAKAEHRGGEWGRDFSARLLALKGGTGVNKWAERVGLSQGLVSAYINGTRLPGAESLRAIAERTGVSLDWLLLGWGGEGPLCRNQTRSRGELEADIVAWVNRALQQAYALELAQDGVPTDLYVWRVDATAILADAVTRIHENEQRAGPPLELHSLLMRLSDIWHRERGLPPEDRRLGSVVDPDILKRLVERFVGPAYRDNNPSPFATRELNVTAYPALGDLEWGRWRAVGDPPSDGSAGP